MLPFLIETASRLFTGRPEPKSKYTQFEAVFRNGYMFLSGLSF
jgi:hypothetical protein